MFPFEWNGTSPGALPPGRALLDEGVWVIKTRRVPVLAAHSDPCRIIGPFHADDALQPRRGAHLGARDGEDKNEIGGSFRGIVWVSRRRPLPERF